MAMTSAKWNRLQQSLPQEDRMTYSEYLNTLGNLEDVANNPQAVQAVTQNLTDAANAARIAADAASAKEAADLNAAANAAAAEGDRLVKEAEAAMPKKETPVVEPTPKETADKLIGPRPVLGGGDKPDKVGGSSQMYEYKPFDEAARRAIFGLNPKTGKAYTDAESAAANGGWNPFAGAKGYEIDPRTGNLNVLMENGTVMTTGAKYETSSAGFIVPQKDSLPPGNASDEFGRYYGPDERMPNETTAQYAMRLSTLGPGTFVENGKVVLYNSRGMFYEQGKPEPTGYLDTPENTLNTAYAKSSNLVSSNALTSASTSTIKLPTGVTVTTTYLDPSTGDTVGVLSNGTTQVLTKGNTIQTQRDSVISSLTDRFNKYGLTSLANKIRQLAVDGATEATITLQLQETPEYQQRFAANADRLKKGLSVLTPAEYINVEDSYRQVLRAYGGSEEHSLNSSRIY